MSKRLLYIYVFVISVLPLGSTLYGQERQTFDRGFGEATVFVPKGQWLTGGTVSYSDYQFKDYTFLVLDNMKADGYTFGISPFLGYFVKDNMAVGARFGYDRTLVRFDNIDINMGDDLNFEIRDYYHLQHVYYGTAMMRNYLPLGQSRIFGIFNEVRMTFGGGQGKVLNGKDDDLTGMYQDIFEFQLGLAPGLAAFITNEVAVEVSIGVLGYKYRKVKQVSDQVYKANFTRHSGNFKIDLFSISLGIAFYIPTLKPNVGKVLGRKK